MEATPIMRLPPILMREGSAPNTFIVTRGGKPMGITISRKKQDVWQAQHDEARHIIVRAQTARACLSALSRHMTTLYKQELKEALQCVS